MDEIRDRTRDIPGVIIEVTKPRAGPATGKPVTVQLSAYEPAVLPAAARRVGQYGSAKSTWTAPESK